MLNNFWNYASPIRNSSIAQNMSTSTINKNYSYLNENISGSFYVITNNSNIQKISSDCLIELNNNFTKDYYFKIKCDGNELIINRNTKLFQFNSSSGNKCITWQENSNFYVFELYNQNISKNKDIIFFLNLPQINPNSILQSENTNETMAYTKPKNNNNEFFSDYSDKENNFLYSNLSYMKNDNRKINKKLFTKKFDEYKEIYFTKGESFIYDKLSEEVIPIKDNPSGNMQSMLKVNYIGNNTYILVLEQNEMIIAFIKIINETDISINENSYSITFNYMNENGENYPYIFKFEEKSLNEINYFKNLILRCIYEKNNNYCDYDYQLNLADFNSLDINSEYGSESNFDKSWLLSTIKKHSKENIFYKDNINNDTKSKNNIHCNKYYKNENSPNNECNVKNININNYGKIGLILNDSSIKLFNEKGEIIKTYIMNIKNQIKHIDVSHDNHYVLITCNKNLVIINTDINDKSAPIFLSLNQNEYWQHNIMNESFNNGKFIKDENSGDKIIVSNLGKYTIIWNLKEVLKGDMSCYHIINNN